MPGHIPRSGDVVNALRGLASLGLVEEFYGKAYRLTENGKMVVERYSMGDPRIRYPFADIRFFIGWDIDGGVHMGELPGVGNPFFLAYATRRRRASLMPRLGGSCFSSSAAA